MIGQMRQIDRYECQNRCDRIDIIEQIDKQI